MKTEPKIKPDLKTYLLNKTIQGFLFILPLLLLIVVFIFLLKIVISFVAPFSSVLNYSINIPVWISNVFSLILLLIILLVIGISISSPKGKGLLFNIEKRYFTLVPLYNTTKNIITQFSSVNDKPFSEVVLADVYNANTHMTAFVIEYLENNFVVVYIPTAPNPTNGFVFHVHKSKIIPLETTTDKAMATVIGMGAGSKDIFVGDAYDKYIKRNQFNSQ